MFNNHDCIGTMFRDVWVRKSLSPIQAPWSPRSQRLELLMLITSVEPNV